MLAEIAGKIHASRLTKCYHMIRLFQSCTVTTTTQTIGAIRTT